MKQISLKFKVVIPVTVMILSAILVALMVVNQVVRTQVLQSVTADLDKSRLVFKEVQKRDWQLLRERSWVTAETPHLKAAVDTGDSTTVQRVIDEIFKTIRSDMLLVTDAESRVLATGGLSRNQIAVFREDSLRFYAEFPEGTIGHLSIGKSIFNVVRSPIVALDNVSQVHVLGYLILGYRVDADYIKSLKQIVKCEIVFVEKGRILLSTFLLGRLARTFVRETDSTRVKTVHLMDEEYLAERVGTANNFILLQSVDQAFRAVIQPIERTMFGVGLFAIVVAFLISSFISREIVTPVKKLVSATHAITEGDYAHPIAVHTRDEIGYLAARFEEMRKTLQQKMSQLEQKNVELEAAMKKLASTQEELLQTEKLAATGKITAQLSHELNNPIHNIRACLETARRKIPEEEIGREFIDLAHEEVLRMGKLIRQMLDFYRPQQITRQKVRLEKLIRDVMKATEKRLSEGNVRFVDKMNSQQVEIDTAPDQLKQVFLNLIFNAIDAMPEGGEISVSTVVDGQVVRIYFADTGRGIAPENRHKIFDAFFTTKAKASGVGLGLSVSYGLVRSLGGNIYVESQVNKGTTFVIELPLHEKERVV